MTTIKIAGVPEHFNLPWHLALKITNLIENIDLQWTDVPEELAKCAKCSGETRHCSNFNRRNCKDIVAGSPTKIVQVYVDSFDLGIHVAAKSPYKTIADLEDKKVLFQD
jgi:hypothetical protein